MTNPPEGRPPAEDDGCSVELEYHPVGKPSRAVIVMKSQVVVDLVVAHLSEQLGLPFPVRHHAMWESEPEEGKLRLTLTLEPVANVVALRPASRARRVTPSTAVEPTVPPGSTVKGSARPRGPDDPPPCPPRPPRAS